MSLDLIRQSGIIPTEIVSEQSVCIIGVGAIGSHTLEALAKMGIKKFTIYDFDTIEPHNLPNQGFGLPDLGKKKVVAAKEKIEAATGCVIEAKDQRVEKNWTCPDTYMISAVDSMAVRYILWEAFLISGSCRYFVDARMGARFGQVFTVDKGKKETMDAYEKTLFKDEEGHIAPCTEKSTIFCAYGLSAFIAAMIAKIIIGDKIDYFVDIDFQGIAVRHTVFGDRPAPVLERCSISREE